MFKMKFNGHNLVHGLIPLFVLVIAAICLLVLDVYLSIDPALIKRIYFILCVVLLLLQTINELMQYLDKDRDSKYGGRREFFRDSKKDWILFLSGLLAGSILFILIISILYQ